MRSGRISIGVVLCLMAAFLLAIGSPAVAHHKGEHAQGGGSTENAKDNDGDADSDTSTSYTEDDDGNDGGTANNQADEGDNAHPSGKDRSTENDANPNQGNSESDPDDDTRGPDRTNGGPDKANGTGGVDLADQDGNNGCGNDDDFEDDNEGWCGKPEDVTPAQAMHDVEGVDTEGDIETTDHGDKVTICHATGSETNPFVLITISEQAWLNGHADHEGDFMAEDCELTNGSITTQGSIDTLGSDQFSDFGDALDHLADVAAGSVDAEAEFGAEVLGETVFNAGPAEETDDAVQGVQERSQTAAPAVASDTVEASAAPGTLPLTGGNAIAYLWLALGLTLTGSGLLRFARSKS